MKSGSTGKGSMRSGSARSHHQGLSSGLFSASDLPISTKLGLDDKGHSYDE